MRIRTKRLGPVLASAVKFGILLLRESGVNCRVIALIDYGSGNLRSAQKALLKVGADVRVVAAPAEIGGARGVVLPGVGAFDDCINALRKQELLEAVARFHQDRQAVPRHLRRLPGAV